MEILSESESVYNSDQIDSDIEVTLYGAIHHSIGSDSGLASYSDNTDSKNSNQTNASIDLSEENAIRSKDIMNGKTSSNESLNNKRKVECIQIDDSTDDSDVVIIDDSITIKIKSKHKRKSLKTSTKTDISLANVNNLNETTLSVMEQFYNEDVYDSEEEEKSFNDMNDDKSVWKISYNDLLLSRNNSNRYYRNKFICDNCKERGHQTRHCPLPKKSPICYLCGLSGHVSTRCKSILCSKCLSRTHRTINCNVLLNQLICDECGLRGHETNQCTYNWRKYHLTTTSTSEPIISELSTNRRISCYNCGAIGKHFGHECHLKAMKNMSPPSPLMLIPRKSRCFNGESNGSKDRNEKLLFNEFVKSISSNELSCLSASFNKPLDHLDLIGMRGTTSASSSNNKNKHIKWIYPQMNGMNGTPITPIIRNSKKNEVIRRHTIFNDWSPLLDNPNSVVSALKTAHSLTSQQINNSMLEKSQTQTTPQLNERSKRKNRPKSVERHEWLKETNITQNKINKNRLKKIRRRMNRKRKKTSNNRDNFE